MTLAEIIEQLARYPESAIIVARRIDGIFLPRSDAAVIEVSVAELDAIPNIYEIAARRVSGMEYFLEISVAQELEEDWRPPRWRFRSRRALLVKRLIEYAENDA